MATDRSRSKRHAITLLLVGVLVASAGCSGLGAGGETPTSTSETTESATPGGTTPSATETTTGDGHGHSHGNDSEGAGENGSSTDGTDGATGKLTVVVAGNEIPLQEQSPSEGSSFWIDGEDPHTWRGSSGQTLAEALSTLGVDAGPRQLSYGGETYSESTEGTGIYVRVNGKSVDPTKYTLSDGDEIWVTVETADMDVETPGDYIKADQQHIHGPMTFEVNGNEVDFSKDKYQSGHKHFHFEGGHADPWHAHSWSMTLEWAMNTLEGINVSENSVTYDGTTYDGSDSGTTVTIEVNGEPVTPSEYYLKDGDQIRIVVETNS